MTIFRHTLINAHFEVLRNAEVRQNCGEFKLELSVGLLIINWNCHQGSTEGAAHGGSSY